MISKNIFWAGLLALAPISSLADDATAPMKADNTGMNARDAKSDTLTPADQASGTKRDVELTRRIRQLVVKDKSLSTQGHNVKIITLQGIATLRGPVGSAAEKSKVEGYAAKVVGADSVRSELDVVAE